MPKPEKKVKTRAPRKAKTHEQILDELKKAKDKVAELEKRAFSGVLESAINSSAIVAEFEKIREKAGSSVSDIAILGAIGKAVGIPRVSVTQSERPKRAPRKSKAKAEK